jgi:predicted phosphate transport protein (TIGR00153 family)
MVFPVETQERVKRRALGVCQDHLRTVMEITRKVSQMLDCFVNEDKNSARELFTEIKGLGKNVDGARRVVAQELAEIGAILISREDFLRFTNLTSEIADFCEGIAFRLIQIIERGWNIPADIKNGLIKLSEATFQTVSKLRETALTLTYGSAKALEKAREVEVAERIVDDLYRELEMKIINSQLEIHVLLLLRDITLFLEDAADKAEDAADVARILAFAM